MQQCLLTFRVRGAPANKIGTKILQLKTNNFETYDDSKEFCGEDLWSPEKGLGTTYLIFL